MALLADIIRKNIDALTGGDQIEYKHIPRKEGQSLPNMTRLKEIISILKDIFFPGFFSEPSAGTTTQQYLAAQMEKLNTLLAEQIRNGLHFFSGQASDVIDAGDAEDLALAFLEKIPEIKRLLCTDVQAMFENDPAAKSTGEVIICYPSIQAMIHYRVAHELLLLGIPVLPRIITELAHSVTGIDIHPGAEIGEYFSIDHGTGVVIGETVIIGNHVNLYKGVTLGAKNFVLDECGNPMNIPRHPIIEDHVVIYSNATVLGRITIGHDSVIGGNVWVTGSVPPHSRVVQQKAASNEIKTGNEQE
ncbi:MAG: serine acetyltransferase [Tannerella sp.]|jgi:serine O-acetyltransferase|nr:serine acetyltransferase [Tannerella sp.]